MFGIVCSTKKGKSKLKWSSAPKMIRSQCKVIRIFFREVQFLKKKILRTTSSQSKTAFLA